MKNTKTLALSPIKTGGPGSASRPSAGPHPDEAALAVAENGQGHRGSDETDEDLGKRASGAWGHFFFVFSLGGVK